MSQRDNNSAVGQVTTRYFVVQNITISIYIVANCSDKDMYPLSHQLNVDTLEWTAFDNK